VTHHWPPDFGAGTLGPAAVILPWEYGDPPQEWVDRVRAQADRVIVPSAYVKDCYVDAGMPPGIVEVVPNGVDLDLFAPDGPRRALDRDAACTFLFVGGTLWRKGIDRLLEAWVRAFGPDDDVRLVIKEHGVDTHYRNQNASQQIPALAARPDVAPIVHLTEHLAPEELPALYRAADVLVHPYRGEGFGLPMLEAMACGVPVVHTAIGPSSEFVGDGGWAVAAKRIGLLGNRDLPPLTGPGYVHDPDLGDLVDALRAAAADPAERRRRGAAAREQSTAFSWARAAADLERVLGDLEAEALPPIRDVVAERPEGRTTLVAYAPDWADDATWQAALEAWTRSAGDTDDVTLALAVAEPDAPAIAERVMAFLDGLGRTDLPDLALHQRPDADPLPLVAGADAVLLDATQERTRPPRLTRRALRTVTVADVPSLLHALKGSGTLTTTEA
jgi:glycosyltransferase involved in cell wall biosynthesis